MRKNILLTGVLGLLALSTLQAQDFRLSPLPQVYETQEDSIDIPTHLSEEQKELFRKIQSLS